jgi:peptidoglycan hydrolase-like protein with peptidoglycan-binding domain
MTKARNLAALLALTGLAVLPACSMFGGDNARTRSSSAGYSTQASAAPNYTAPAPQVMPPLTPEMVRSVQQALQQDGLYRGSVDGTWGPATQAAVRGYQERHNMSATGQLDQPTLAAMNLMPHNSAQRDVPADQRIGRNYNPPADRAPAPNSVTR